MTNPSATSGTATVRVRILENDYQIGCPPQEKEALITAARYLDEKMRAIKSGGNVIGVERVAVMAGLNIAHELLKQGRDSRTDDETIQRLADKIAQALGNQAQLEL